MLTREHLRLKVFQTLYAYYLSENRILSEAQNQLQEAVEQTYDAYLLYWVLLDELLRYSTLKIEEGKRKHKPSPEEQNPNLKWIENPLLQELKYHSNLAVLAKNRKLSLQQEHELIQNLYQFLIQSEEYQTYMQENIGDYETEKKALLKIFKKVIVNYEPFHTFLEERSIFVQLDDIDRICSMFLKNLKEFQKGQNNEIYPAYKAEYKNFYITLLEKTIVNSNWIEEILRETAENWNLDRFAQIDTVLLKMALSEAVEFHSIPAKVTMNEYIEFAKNYSTEKSSAFVNGLLEKCFIYLENTGRIHKMDGLIKKQN